MIEIISFFSFQIVVKLYLTQEILASRFPKAEKCCIVNPKIKSGSFIENRILGAFLRYQGCESRPDNVGYAHNAANQVRFFLASVRATRIVLCLGAILFRWSPYPRITLQRLQDIIRVFDDVPASAGTFINNYSFNSFA